MLLPRSFECRLCIISVEKILLRLCDPWILAPVWPDGFTPANDDLPCPCPDRTLLTLRMCSGRALAGPGGGEPASSSLEWASPSAMVWNGIESTFFAILENNMKFYSDFAIALIFSRCLFFSLVLEQRKWNHCTSQQYYVTNKIPPKYYVTHRSEVNQIWRHQNMTSRSHDVI